jgi:hypothetical protein
MTSHRIAPLPGYTPTVGRLVAMLTYTRERLLGAVEGLSQAELDHEHDAGSNGIGALLAHVAAVERFYQVATLEEREPSAEESAAWDAALKLRISGRRTVPRDLQSRIVRAPDVLLLPFFFSLEPRRPLGGHPQRALHGNPHAADRSLVEQPSHQRDAVGHPSWR